MGTAPLSGPWQAVGRATRSTCADGEAPSHGLARKQWTLKLTCPTRRDPGQRSPRPTSLPAPLPRQAVRPLSPRLGPLPGPLGHDRVASALKRPPGGQGRGQTAGGARGGEEWADCCAAHGMRRPLHHFGSPMESMGGSNTPVRALCSGSVWVTLQGQATAVEARARLLQRTTRFFGTGGSLRRVLCMCVMP